MGVSLLLGVVLYLKVLTPLLHFTIPCVFRKITGFYCPGCGITRMCASLLRLDFYQAFRYNMLVFFLVPLFIIYEILAKRGHQKQNNAWMVAMICMTLLFGILRNIPMFSFLAPTQI